MGFFTPRRGEIETALMLKAFKTNELVMPETKWSRFSRSWAVNFALFARMDLEMLDKYWADIIKGTGIEVAFKELVAYYLFHALSRQDIVERTNPDSETFVREVSEIFDLSVNQVRRVAEYVANFGPDVIKKFFDAPSFTPQLQEEFAALKLTETKSLLEAIASGIKNFNNLPIPNDQIVRQIGKERGENGVAFVQMLKEQGLLSQ